MSFSTQKNQFKTIFNKNNKMKKINLIIALMFAVAISKAQTWLPIPDTLSGSNFNLILADSSVQIYAGFNTATNAYNGAMYGPTMILNKGQNVTMNVMNMLMDTTTTHWHGLHVAPMNDGSPHNPIMAGNTWSPSFTVMDNAATYWYHPHLHGKTMEQVIRGASGLIIVRDSVESALTLPRTYGIDDIPVITKFVRIDSTSKQFIMDDEIDNTVLVNGVLSPQVNVPAQVVRLRLLNASSHRFFDFGINDGRTFHQITSDDGLLNAPVAMTKLTLGSGERAEILVDFSGQVGSTYYLKQYGTQLPAGYPGGPPDQMGMMAMGPLDNTDFNLLQFNVVAQTATPVTTIPTTLTSNTVWSQVGAATRTIAITASPMMSMTNFLMNNVKYDMNVINFTTTQNTIEKWTITNQSMMPHPFHIHGNHFFVLSVNGATPPANMQGRKDVVVIPPMGGNIQLITNYEDFNDVTIPYMYHCHILSHEDNGMMGQFIVNPISTGVNIVTENNIQLANIANPVTDSWLISGTSAEPSIAFQLFNTLGEILFYNKIQTTGNNFQMDIPASQLASGVYFLQVITTGGSQSVKLIKN
ncbi:MAG: hypothetical protein RL065_1265 [Bacteroidota bacterium]|jgi:bilirubin oxidase